MLYLCGFDLRFIKSTLFCAKVLSSPLHKHIHCINSIDYEGVSIKETSKNYTYSKQEINRYGVLYLLKGKFAEKLEFEFVD